jgi:chromosome segregation ATPase
MNEEYIPKFDDWSPEMDLVNEALCKADDALHEARRDLEQGLKERDIAQQAAKEQEARALRAEADVLVSRESVDILQSALDNTEVRANDAARQAAMKLAYERTTVSAIKADRDQCNREVAALALDASFQRHRADELEDRLKFTQGQCEGQVTKKSEACARVAELEASLAEMTRQLEDLKDWLFHTNGLARTLGEMDPVKADRIKVIRELGSMLLAAPDFEINFIDGAPVYRDPCTGVTLRSPYTYVKMTITDKESK